MWELFINYMKPFFINFRKKKTDLFTCIVLSYLNTFQVIFVNPIKHEHEQFAHKVILKNCMLKL